MFLAENPVLQRELLVNLRAPRAFLLLLVYQGLLALVVLLAWPQQPRLEANAVAARQLVDLVFFGQYILASLMAPSFTAGSISGEKERKTYEMLLASPLRPSAIVLGKLLAALTHLAVLIVSSLPIVLLCLPLGGVSLYEVLAAYLGLILSVIAFGMISLACSSYFNHTAAALVVSYLIILPLAMAGVILWGQTAQVSTLRLLLTVTVLPVAAFTLAAYLFQTTSRRLLYPPDVGSEGKEVVEEEEDTEEIVGLVIQRDLYPDRLFAPPRREDLLSDGANPVYEKEIQSEIFSQGTLMLRLVIQISMILAIPLMAGFIFMMPALVPWYVAYTITFTILVSPVFLAGSVTNERERQTLDLLLTTNISPGQILWGKLLAGLRVSSVLTLFLLWPMFLGCCLVTFYWKNALPMVAYVAIIFVSCLTAGLTALFFSVISRKTATSLICSYLVVAVVCFGPMAVDYFARTFFARSDLAAAIGQVHVLSPYAAAFAVPLATERYDYGLTATDNVSLHRGSWFPFFAFLTVAMATNIVLVRGIEFLFHRRWRISQ